jgi:hypothetical protein
VGLMRHLESNAGDKARKSLPARFLEGPWPQAVWRPWPQAVWRPWPQAVWRPWPQAVWRPWPQAVWRPWPPWRLIATVPKLEFESTHSKHKTLSFSNRNKNALSGNSSWRAQATAPRFLWDGNLHLRAARDFPGNHDSRKLRISEFTSAGFSWTTQCVPSGMRSMRRFGTYRSRPFKLPVSK